MKRLGSAFQTIAIIKYNLHQILHSANNHTRMILRSFLLCRTYATAAKRPSRLGKTVDLDHVRVSPIAPLPKFHPPAADFNWTVQFLQRNKAIALWRSIVRGCRRIENQNTREDTLKFAREEFRRNRNVEDIVCQFSSSILPSAMGGRH